MIVHEAPELYKAMALLYNKIPEGENWRFVHSRVSELVSGIERLHFNAQALGVEASLSLRKIGAELLAKVESGDAAGVLEVCESAERYVEEVMAVLNTMRLYAIASRLGASIVSLLSSAFLSIISLLQGMEGALLISALAAGFSISSVLLSRGGAALWTLFLSLLAQIIAAFLLYQSERIAVASVVISMATIILAFVVSRTARGRTLALLKEDIGARSLG